MEDQLRTFRRYSRVFPSVPYARHAPRVGCSVVADAKTSAHSSSSKSHGNGSSVKILALLCTKQPTATTLSSDATPANKRGREEVPDELLVEEKEKRVKSEDVGSSHHLREQETAEADVTSTTNKKALHPASLTPAPGEATTEAKSHLYVRVQYDRALITTLPIEVMRKQHPQVLIDYLLSMSVWA